MTLYMIGLGLFDLKDISLRGYNAIKECDKVYLENYTAIFESSADELSAFYKKEVIVANRDMVEKESDKILKDAKDKNVAFLVVGDVFGATTHTDLFLRANEKGIDIKIINNASIMNVVGITGLELYKFGKTTSIVFDDDNWLPITPYKVLEENLSIGAHTLFLLDIKVAEPSKLNLIKGINIPEPPRFMSVNKGLEILKKLENKEKKGIITKDTLVVGVARLGHEDFVIKAGKLSEIKKHYFGAPMHSIIIPGKLHEIESEMLRQYS